MKKLSGLGKILRLRKKSENIFEENKKIVTKNPTGIKFYWIIF